MVTWHNYPYKREECTFVDYNVRMTHDINGGDINQLIYFGGLSKRGFVNHLITYNLDWGISDLINMYNDVCVKLTGSQQKK